MMPAWLFWYVVVPLSVIISTAWSVKIGRERGVLRPKQRPGR